VSLVCLDSRSESSGEERSRLKETLVQVGATNCCEGAIVVGCSEG
jgi:hypothetical protein